MSELSTRPDEMSGARQKEQLWQSSELEWHFRNSRRAVVQLESEQTPPEEKTETDNTSKAPTAGPQAIKSPGNTAFAIRPERYGRRGMQTLSEWEGVVERVFKDGFQCRITPTVHGVADPTKIESTDFTFDDLSTDADRSLVRPGAVLYWTIARSSNIAGTVSNLSLVRLRRLPNITSAQALLAQREADEMMIAFAE